jgi:hypothetical protein
LEEKSWTLDELYAKSDDPATEPVPRRSDVQEYVFEGEDVSCDSDGSTVRIRATGDLTPVHPAAIVHYRVSLDELRKVAAGIDNVRAFRPTWLDAMFAPRLRPHIYAPPIGGARFLLHEQNATGWPWSAIGKVIIQRRFQQPGSGSGVLVGPRLLLTASHVMPWDTEDFSIRFIPHYRYGNDPRFGHAYVDEWRGVINSDDVTGLDYVICKLNWRIGDRTGWMGSHWSSDESFYYDRSWISVGYPYLPGFTERPQLEIPVWVRDIDNDADGLEIETDMFATKGWSGGPLWGWIGGDPRVVGVESGFENDGFDPVRSVFAGGEHLVNLVKYGWANWA